MTGSLFFQLLIAMFSYSAILISGNTVLDVSPMNQTIPGGSLVSVTCTKLSSDNNPVSAGVLGFLLNDILVPAENVTVVNSTSATLQWVVDYVTSPVTHHVTCLDSETNATETALVHVQDSMPKRAECIYYNWKTMNCTFEPVNMGIRNDQFKTVLQYSELQNNWYRCENPGHNYCYFNKANSGIYTFKLVVFDLDANHETRYMTLWHENNIHHVKPTPVKGLSCTARARDIEITWTTGEPSFRRFQYLVNVSAERNNFEQSYKFISNNDELQHTATQLHPHEQYTVSVARLPVVRVNVPENGTSVRLPRGYWSNPVNIVCTTQPEVPGANPVTHQRAWEHIVHSKHKIRIFFKPVPRDLQYGDFMTHEVWYTLHDGSNTSASADISTYEDTMHNSHWHYTNTADTSAVLNISNATSVSYVVVLRNNVGVNSHLLLDVITLRVATNPASNTDSQFGVIMDNSNTSVVNVYYTSEPDTRSTVLWCRKHDARSTCMGPISWLDLNSTSNHTQLPLPHSDTADLYRYGISTATTAHAATNSSEVSSAEDYTTAGIVWNHCLYRSETKLQPPQDFSVSERGHVKWTSRSCQESTYILHYKILYCITSECSSKNGDNEKPIVIDSSDTGSYSYSLSTLEEDMEYTVTLCSVGLHTAACEAVTTTISYTDGLSRTMIIVVSVVTVCVFGVVYVYVAKKYCRKIRMCIFRRYPAELPPHEDIPMDSSQETSETQLRNPFPSSSSLTENSTAVEQATSVSYRSQPTLPSPTQQLDSQRGGRDGVAVGDDSNQHIYAAVANAEVANAEVANAEVANAANHTSTTPLHSSPDDALPSTTGTAARTSTQPPEGTGDSIHASVGDIVQPVGDTTDYQSLPEVLLPPHDRSEQPLLETAI